MSAAPRIGTVRLQLQAGFPFDAAAERVPYFARLGLSHLYLSPIQQARRGSTHGYDGVDPTRIDCERGGRDGFERLVQATHRHGLGLIVDIVPNHLSSSLENAWWYDLLEHGRASRYARFFAIDWRGAGDRVVLPFLRAAPQVLHAEGALALCWDAPRARLAVDADGVRYPFRAGAYAALLRQVAPEWADLFENAAFDDARAQLRDALAEPPARERFAARLAGLGRDWSSLSAWLERQAYRLCDWRETAQALNWRRFFDITELVALESDRTEVFEAVHALIFELYARGQIDGVRVDHLDGLACPQRYTQRLRRRFERLRAARPRERRGGRAWIVVEKILATGEPLRRWPVDGSTGYDFTDQVGGLLHDAQAEAEIARLWRGCGGASFARIARAAREERLAAAFAPEFERLLRAVRAVHADLDAAVVARALRELLVAYPRYRGYARVRRPDRDDASSLQGAVETAAAHGADTDALERLHALLRGECAHSRAAQALTRFQQLTAPLAARAIEDTAFYRYVPLLSRNEVGSQPDRFAWPAEAFHRAAAARGRYWPHALLATASHDHKRGEDARMRLASLTDVAAQWTATARRWLQRYAPERGAPDVLDRLALVQTLVAIWPVAAPPSLDELRRRAGDWLLKAIRERKQHGSWEAPDAAYEDAALAHLDRLLGCADFRAEIGALVDAVARPACVRGLVQTTLRCTVPGVPDLYQGGEFWDHSLVDPDNRGAVDYAARERALQRGDPLDALQDGWRDGRIKQRLLARLLAARRAWPQAFGGAYRALHLDGPMAERFLAFERSGAQQRVVVVVPIRPAALLGADLRLDARRLAGTCVRIGIPSAATDLLDDAVIAAQPHLALDACLARWPVAVLAFSSSD